MKIPFDNFLTFSKRSGWLISAQATAQIINPTRVIRKCRVAKNIIEKVGG